MTVVLALIQTNPLLLQQSCMSSQPVGQLPALVVVVVEPSARQSMLVADCLEPSAEQPMLSALCAERSDWTVVGTEPSRYWHLLAVILS